MHVLVHLFESDLLIAQNLANENAAFVPTDVPGRGSFNSETGVKPSTDPV